jgi:large subunit ribosomal protein L6
MSRVGKNPVTVPQGVTVNVMGTTVKVKGKLGETSMTFSEDINIALEGDKVSVKPARDTQQCRMMWGTGRALIAKMVKGVTDGYTKNLEMNGTGYKAVLQGNDLVLTVGKSHEVRYKIPAGIKIATAKPTEISVSGINAQQVGQVAADIRGVKPPEPYKGKGIKYSTEKVRRKEGKKK